MSELGSGIVSALVGALAGGVAGFFASRLNSHLDSRGKITISPSEVSINYQLRSDQFSQNIAMENKNEIVRMIVNFSLEIRNESKIKKDFKKARVILRSDDFPDKEYVIYSNFHSNTTFENSMMDSLESRILRLQTRIPKKDFVELTGKKVDLYLSILNSKNKSTEKKMYSFENFFNN